MQPELILVGGTAAWLAIMGVALLTRRVERGSGVGLVLLYLALMALIHMPGALVHALPWFARRELDLVAAGYGQAVLGAICFGLGALALEPLAARLRRRAAPAPPPPAPPPPAPPGPPPGALVPLPAGPAFGAVGAGQAEIRSVALGVAALGMLATTVLVPLTAGVPTGRSIAANVAQLLTIGIALGCWWSWRERRAGALQLWLAAALLLPLFTIVADGFLGFGATALLSVACLMLSLSRPRWRWLLVGLVAGYLGLSFYVTYMRDREVIRASVWGGAALGARADQMASTLGSVELFDPRNQGHLRAIDIRLNQNVLAGLTISYLDAGLTEYAAGETFLQAAAALVPRVLWPDKPYTAGGSALVTRFTGVEFDAATSVGIGQVIEFYANFGVAGVCLGFAALGMLVGFFDRRAALRLRGGDQIGFIFWYLPGLALMLPGNSLAELVSSLGAALLTALLITRLILPPLLSPAPGWRR
jgi:hypothetical protein